MSKKTFILRVLIIFPLLLKAMKNQEEQRICCLPKKSFGNEDCYERRTNCSYGGLGVSVGLTCVKMVATSEIWCCMNASCKNAWQCSWIGPNSFDQWCDARSTCCINSCAFGSTILTGIGLAVALCSWNPLCDQNGVNKELLCHKKKLSHETIKMNNEN